MWWSGQKPPTGPRRRTSQPVIWLALAQAYSVPNMQQVYTSSSIGLVTQSSLRLEFWQVTANQRYWQHKAGRPRGLGEGWSCWGGGEVKVGHVSPYQSIWFSHLTPSPHNTILLVDLWSPNFPSISCGTLILKPDRKGGSRPTFTPQPALLPPHLVLV